MNIVHENAIAIILGPRSTEINHGARVCVTTTCFIRSAVPAVRCSANVMPVVSDGFDIVVRVRIEVQASLTLVTCTLNNVIQMRNDTGCEKRLASIVEIDAPRIARAVCKHFEGMASGMVSPDPCVEGLAILVGCPWFTDTRMREYSMATIQPAIWSPNECV